MYIHICIHTGAYILFADSASRSWPWPALAPSLSARCESQPRNCHSLPLSEID